MNDEDSDGDSDDDIVLDQSLAVSQSAVGVAAPVLAPTAVPEVQPNIQLPPPSAVEAITPQSVAPTIVTIAPPTLKSSKSDLKGTLPAQPMAPPIPLRERLPSANDQSASTEDGTEANGAAAIEKGIGARDQEEDDGIIRPRVDPKLLRLMSLSGKIGGDENSFFDTDGSTERPWNADSADITDWFNYGFNERTWRQYCGAQVALRGITATTNNSGGALSHHHPPQHPPQQHPPQQHPIAPHHQQLPPPPQPQQQRAQHLPPPPQPQPPSLPVPHHQMAHQSVSAPHPAPHPAPHQRARPPFVARPTPPIGPNGGGPPMVPSQSAAAMKKENAEEMRPRPPAVAVGVCFDFQNKGHCLRGAGCRWSHEKRDEHAEKFCFEFQNKGSCSYGAQCRWRHIPPPKGLPPKQQILEKDQTTDQLQARLRLILGEAPNIPSFVSKLDADDGHKKSKRKKRSKRSSEKRSRSKRKRSKRSRSRSSSDSEDSVSRSRSRDPY